MNLLTIIVLIIFALCMLRGYRKGFVKSLASMVSLIASLILVSFVSPYVTEFLANETQLYQVVEKKCQETFSIDASALKNAENDKNTETESVQDKTVQEQLIETLPIPTVLKNMLEENNTQEKYKELAVSSFNEYVPKFMTELFVNIISFIITWVVVIAAVWIAVRALDIVASLPLIRGINQILGIGLGVVQATIIVWIGMLVLTIFSNSDVGKQLMTMISESEFLTALYQSNLILDFLQNTVKNFF